MIDAVELGGSRGQSLSFEVYLKRIFLVMIAAAAVVFFLLAALKYFNFTEGSYTIWWVNRWPLLFHVIAGSIALFAGPVQFIAAIRNRYLKVHRAIGTMYVGAVVLGSLSGYYLAFNSVIGPLLGYSLVVQSTAWLATTLIALACILQYRVAEHRLWMTRSYIVTSAFVGFRFLFETPFLADFPPHERSAVIIWFAWIPTLLVFEVGRQVHLLFSRKTLPAN
jgi:uncharacterized membrane protein